MMRANWRGGAAALMGTVLLSAASWAGEVLPSLPEPTASKLPRWRGFNLIEKFHRDWRNGPFLEEDFRLIHELGFNFVRLPMDYRVWIVGDDWTQFAEKPLREIDQAVEWGGRYGIHVCLNFHRAPGYTVASPPEPRSLWTDPESQRVCALHWGTFARRYRAIGNDRLSFNLFNEPANVAPDVYLAVVKRVVDAIRAEDPHRLIISDGLEYGQKPILALVDLQVAQATRGYLPMDVTHFQADWVTGAGQFATPAWPRPVAQGTLYAPAKTGMKPEATEPLRIRGPFREATQLRLHLLTVSSRAKLLVRGDERTLWEREFVCGPGEGEWKEVRFLPEWKVYQNTFDRDYLVEVPAGTRGVEIAVVEGDWLRLSEIGLRRSGAPEDVLALRPDWDRRPAQVHYEPGRPDSPYVAAGTEDRRWLWETAVAPWREVQSRGVGLVVGEFGCFNRTPHAVVLAWMEDCLANWREAGWGWALWNFRGSFGVLDSGRTDVVYEDFQGHKLDRKMLELLQKY